MSSNIERAVLPSLVFFNPTENCLDWLKSYIKKRPVVDCGSGVGRLSLGLLKRKIKAVPIDICLREDVELSPLLMDVLDFQFALNSVGIIARPCRGCWIHNTIDKVIEKEGEILYIELQKHYDQDLKPLKSKYLLKKVYEDASDDGEYIYSIKSFERERVKMKTFSLLFCKLQGNFWYLSDGDKWRNSAGGYMPKRDEDIIVETIEAESFDDLDWTKTNILKPESNIGWLSRHGKFYGCGYMGHDTVAYYILKKDVLELENTGWVRILGKNDYYCEKRLSPEQRNFLSIKGHLISEDD